MLALDAIAALLFVGSAGVLFNDKFRKSKFLAACAGLIALASTYFLTKEIVREVVREETAPPPFVSQEQPAPSASLAKPSSDVSAPGNTPVSAPQEPTEFPPQSAPEEPQPHTSFVKLTESNTKDIWSTSVYSYAPGGGGPGGGLENDRLRVGGWGDQYVALVQFNLPKVSCSSKVVLELYNTNDSHSPTAMYFDVITSPWDWKRGDRLWWRDLPNTESWENRVIPAPGLNAWLSIDISDLFDAWCAGKMPNYGLMLKPVENNNNYNTFYSTRYAGTDDLGPRLVITY